VDHIFTRAFVRSLALPRLVGGAAVVLVFLGLAAPARAQIYSWRDENGHLVLSNQRPAHAAEQVRTYAVPKSEAVRATRLASGERSRQYDDVIVENARLHNIRTDLVRAVVQVESAFNPSARSIKGAIGLMQLMPAIWRQYGVSNPFDPIQNIRAGVAYLRELLDRYQNDEQLALAAYNAGPNAVDRHGQTVPPYRETRNYVAQINHMAARPIEMRGTQIFKVTEIVDGQPIVRYTDKKPTTGGYEVVGRR
jgi:soluble lytic murein transglycosylase-like protein